MRISLSASAVIFLSYAASAQPPAPPTTPQLGGIPGQYIPHQNPLYRMNDVSKSLNLTPQQIASLNAANDQTYALYRDKYNALGAMNETERYARQQELNRQYFSDWNKTTSTVFNENQRNRYQQYHYQYNGFANFYDPDVQKRLSLSPDQLQNLREQDAWSNQQRQEIYRIGATNPSRGNELHNAYWKARQERIEKYLTAEQIKAWKQMTGDPYTFNPNFSPNR